MAWRLESGSERCPEQLGNANSTGANAREEKHFLHNAVGYNSTRRAVWDLLERQIRLRGGADNQNNQRAILNELLANLRTVIPETDLERRLRKKAEFDGLEHGSLMQVRVPRQVLQDAWGVEGA